MSECTGNCSICHNYSELIEKAEKEIKSNRVLKVFEYENLPLPTSGVINLTDECNNRCPYCFVCFQKNYMSYETAEQAAFFLLENNERNKEKTIPAIAFFGGEPLLQYDNIIKPLITKFKDKFSWSITTNGTLLTEEIIDFLAENNVSILLSWDGIKEVQDIQRPLVTGESSFDKIIENIHYLLLKCPETLCRMTITKLGIPHIFETLLMWERYGVKKCAFCINEDEEYFEKDFNLMKDEFEKCALYIYKKLLKGESPIIITPFNTLYSTIKEGDYEPYFHNEFTRCGMGTTSIGISYDGTLNPCQEENSTKKFAIGDIWTGIDKDKHKDYLNKYFNIMDNLHCEKNCPSSIRYICFNSLCPNSIIQDNGNISDAKCLYHRAMYYAVGRLYQNCRASIFPNIRSYFER